MENLIHAETEIHVRSYTPIQSCFDVFSTKTIVCLNLEIRGICRSTTADFGSLIPITFSSKEHMGTVITTGLHDAGIRTKSKHEKENCVDSTFNTNKISVDHVYSMRSDLSTDDVQAFEAEEFVLGHIPLIPPPKSMA
uniref:Ovule protein n=1 Tax=Heterorhabditis bacteriophora TaxID=37862 RepID=A0A1I7X3X9_HETBA